MGGSQDQRKAGLGALRIIVYSLVSSAGILLVTSVIVLAVANESNTRQRPEPDPEWVAQVDQLNRVAEHGLDAALPSAPALVGLDQKRVTRAALRAVFGAEGFEFADATEPPQQVGQKDTTVVALVGASSSLTQESVMSIPGDTATDGTIMLGMALALQQLAPWASDWWVEAGPRLAQQASDAEGKTSSEYTTNETVRVELTVNATLPMLMLTVERAEP